MSDRLLDDDFDLKKVSLRYFSFWPYFLVSVIIFSILAFVYLRYVEYNYETFSKIEIIDKSQDSEMALPTAMTIFNRSMINLENEMGVLKSFKINKSVVSFLKYNVNYYTIGNIKTTQNHKTDFLFDYDIKFKVDTDSINSKSSYEIILDIEPPKMKIEVFDQDENFIKSYTFDSYNSGSVNNDLPFDINIRKISYLDDDKKDNLRKKIVLEPFEKTINRITKELKIEPTAQESDQLVLSLISANTLKAEDYLNTLVSVFDRDGIIDRQLEYKRTMNFVDNRSVFLLNELEKIEIQKQNFKQINNFTNIQSDTQVSISQQFNYDSELFEAESQKDLLNLLSLELNDKKFDLLPVNIGLENSGLNNLISDYNLILKERDKFLQTGAGAKNPYILNLNNQLQRFFNNILESVKSYDVSLNKKIQNITEKEKEFETNFKSIPEKEKILRSIERKLEVKESLYLLLLQKREEAAINNAVVKPSIKIIDNAISSTNPKTPNKQIIIFASLVLGIAFPFTILSLIFYFDNKVHVRDDLASLNNIPLIGEVPYDKAFSNNKFDLNSIKDNSRLTLIESIRMLIANLKYLLIDNNDSSGKLILISSSIKGEGKTIVSSSIAKVLSFSEKKVILIGADLRNPQLHKSLFINKNVKGLSDYIYKSDISLNEIIIKNGKLDVIVSGPIPPNPTELLNSIKYKNLLNELKKEYDYVIIDSAPCLLVADTLQFSDMVDISMLVIRANHSDREVLKFIKDLDNKKQLKNISLVLNGVGSSGRYGYNYAYQYGYQYGYNYSYGYGYSEDKD